MRKGLLLVISGPAGAGKGTMKDMLLERDKGFHFSISATTRAPRPGEVDGIHYDFISKDEFMRREAEGDFLETATVHGHLYGTPLKPVMRMLDDGEDMLFDIDTQGALKIMETIKDCVSVFVTAPTFTEIEKRLRKRGTECEEDMQRRLRNAREEVKALHRYRYVIVNDDLEIAYRQLEAVIEAERINTNRYQPEIGP